MARVSISLALLLVGSYAFAQPFGAFGYVAPAWVRPFEISLSGFKIHSKNSAVVSFSQPCTAWKCSEISDKQFTAVVSDSGLCPRKLRIDLLSPGFSLYFESGVFLDFDCKECPFLSWSEGSVGADVPTPPTKSILISFRDDQPPLLLSFPQTPGAFIISGTPGHWILRTTDLEYHWMRVAAPLGETGYPTPNVASLGELSRKLAPVQSYFAGSDATLLNVTTTQDGTSITADWHYNQPGALIPPSAFFAPLGNDPIEVLSPITNLAADDEDGPMLASTTSDLKIRFPFRPLGVGRALQQGAPAQASPVQPSLAIPGLVQMALANLEASASNSLRDAVNRLPKDFIASAADSSEPFTGQRLPFSPSGEGMDLTAAYALLIASHGLAENDPRVNPLLLSLLLRRSWSSWMVDCPDRSISRRATVLSSVACAMSDKYEVRLEGCMMEAGLAAQTGGQLWRAHHGFSSPASTFAEPLLHLRDALFRGQADAFADSLRGPHVLAAVPIEAQSAKDQTTIQWTAFDPSEYDLQFFESLASVKAGHNVTQVTTSRNEEGFLVKANTADAGPSQIVLSPPLPVPQYVAPPTYFEQGS